MDTDDSAVTARGKGDGDWVEMGKLGSNWDISNSANNNNKVRK